MTKILGNGLYLKAVPPPSHASSSPWKLIVGGPVPGAAERFRYTDEGYLYSHLMGTCLVDDQLMILYII